MLQVFLADDGFGFRLEKGLGFRVQGSGFRKFRVQSLGSLGFRVLGTLGSMV